MRNFHTRPATTREPGGAWHHSPPYNTHTHTHTHTHKGKAERVSKQKLLKDYHENVSVLAILEGLEFFLSANHGGR